jgi:C-methyltransferase
VTQQAISSGETILDLLTGLWRAGAVKAAMELDLFTKIAEGRKSSSEIAGAIGASERGTIKLLNALCGLGLLEKRDGRYRVDPGVETYLSKTSPNYIENLHLGIAAPWEWQAFGDLAEAVKKGKPTVFKYMEGQEIQCLEKMVLAIGTLGIASAERICDVLGIGTKAAQRLEVLDLACGTGVYGFTIARRVPMSRITSVDRRPILKHAQRLAENMGVADRISFRPGNIFSLRYPEDHFDMVLISNVLHQYNRERTLELLRKAHSALRSPEGTIIVHDFIADDNRVEATGPLLMSLDMLLYTEDGDVHTQGEYESWLEEAGFENVTRPFPIRGNVTAIITAKKSR